MQGRPCVIVAGYFGSILLAGSYRIADVLSVNRGSITFLASALLIAASSVIIFAIARSFFNVPPPKDSGS